MICERAAVARAKRRDALCFVRFMVEQMSVPALNTCANMLREGNVLGKTLRLQALMDIHQTKPMRVKEPVELEPLTKIDEIRRFSNKELRLTKELLMTLLKSSKYCGPISNKPYQYVSGIVGMVYKPFMSEHIRDCYLDYEQAVLLRFWLTIISTIRRIANTKSTCGLYCMKR